MDIDIIAKPWWQSRTVMAILAGMIAKALMLVGIETDAALLTDVGLLTAAYIADLVALWGRSQAQAPLRWRR